MCRQHKGILTELLNKRPSPGTAKVGFCLRTAVLTFFLSELLNQAWFESIIAQVKRNTSFSLFVGSFFFYCRKKIICSLLSRAFSAYCCSNIILLKKKFQPKYQKFFLQMYFNMQVLCWYIPNVKIVL